VINHKRNPHKNKGSLATRKKQLCRPQLLVTESMKKINIQEIFRDQTLKTKKCVGSPLDVNCKICPETS